MRLQTYGTVYGLWCFCHPSDGIRYVGQTTQPYETRLTRHASAALRARAKGASLYHSQRWILSHGVENICITALDFGIDGEDLDTLERIWISQFSNLTNHLPGGRKGVAPAAKMPERSVHEIRALCKRLVPQELIAKKYGTTVASVSNISRGATWKNLPDLEPDFDINAWLESIFDSVHDATGSLLLK